MSQNPAGTYTWETDFRWARRNFPPSGDQCENFPRILCTFCTVKRPKITIGYFHRLDYENSTYSCSLIPAGTLVTWFLHPRRSYYMWNVKTTPPPYVQTAASLPLGWTQLSMSLNGTHWTVSVGQSMIKKKKNRSYSSSPLLWFSLLHELCLNKI